jgi:Asp-tRNA(Asn)/Glu-tRNA(Gln) amidotransferase A subunit family amidase
MFAAAVASSMGQALAQTTSSTTQADEISADDIAVADRIAGRSYSAAERKLMAGSLSEKRKLLISLRSRSIDPNIEPAVRFDPRLPDTVLPPGPSRCNLGRRDVPEYDGNVESLAFATAVELSQLVRAKKVSSMELTKMYLARLKSIGPKLLCVVNLTEELALQQAGRADEEIAAGKHRGPLHGIPFGVKDLLATKGIPTTWGAKPYIDQVFDYDATVVKRLADAGAVLVAKLSLGELAMGDVWFGGKTRNPWKPAEGSSGSSAGPCSAVAAGLMAFAIGSETLGSIISPCVVNGTTGLRPTYGRISRYGAMPLCRTMDKLGPITRGVEDCAAILSAIFGPDGRDGTCTDAPFNFDASADVKSLRVGFDPSAFENMSKNKDQARKKCYADALEKIRASVGDLKPLKLPPTDNYKGLAGLTIACESASAFSELNHSGRLSELAQQEEGSWPTTFRVGSTIPAADYLRGQQVRSMLQREFASMLDGIDCYVTIPYAGATLAYTNLTGHPSLITRCGAGSDGLPLMIEFIGNLYREDAILRLALAYEQATDWHKSWPDTTKIPALSPSS